MNSRAGGVRSRSHRAQCAELAAAARRPALLVAGAWAQRPTAGPSSSWRSAASPTGSTASSPGCCTRPAGSASSSTRPPTGSTSSRRCSRCRVRHIMPWWLAGVLVGRDVVLAGFLPVLKRHGYGPLARALPRARPRPSTCCTRCRCCLLGDGHETVNHVARIVGWAFAIWGTALYWWAGGLYAIQVRQLVRADRLGVPPSVRRWPDHVEGAAV